MDSLKAEALFFYGSEGHAKNVLELMEDVANKLFYDRPDDINGYIVKYFEKLCLRPILTKIHARFVTTKCWPSFHIDVYVKVRNDIKIFRSCAISNFLKTSNNFDIYSKIIEKSINIVNNTLSQKFCNVNLDNQISMDEYLREFLQFCLIEMKAIQCNSQPNHEASNEKHDDLNRRKTSPKSPIFKINNTELHPILLSIASVSRALCVTSSVLSDIPLYRYISESFDINSECYFSMPSPLISVFESQLDNTKFKYIKEFLLIPAPNMSPNEIMLALVKILHNYRSTVKSQFKNTTKGNEGTTFEGPNEIIERLQDTISQAGYSCGKDFYLGLDCATNEIYSEESDSYETSPGVYKSGKYLRQVWLSMISKYPSIICLVDPLHRKNKDEWKKLCGQVSSKCFVVTSLVGGDESCQIQTSGILISLDNLNTVSDLWLSAFQNKAQNFLLFATCEGETCDTFPVDMAVALRAAFIKIGDTSTTEASISMNRLSQIHEELSLSEKLCPPCDRHTFHQVGELYEEEEDVMVEELKEREPDNKSKARKSKAKK